MFLKKHCIFNKLETADDEINACSKTSNLLLKELLLAS